MVVSSVSQAGRQLSVNPLPMQLLTAILKAIVFTVIVKCTTVMLQSELDIS